MARFRTTLHRTCLLDGKHPEESKYAAECPVLWRARRRQDASESPARRVAPPPRARRVRHVATAAEEAP